MDYFTKYEKNEFKDLLWNVPEQKQGRLCIVGGNMQNFRTEVKLTEYVASHSQIKEIWTVLPDALRDKMPDIDGLKFLSSTEAGSFANGEEMLKIMDTSDYNIMIGDFSKNSVTLRALLDVCREITKPTIITRDTVDAIAVEGADGLLMNENLIIMGSMPQLQKLFRAIYYPKILMMTQSLIQVSEALHKFTLSYPVKIVTLHNAQIIIAENGRVVAVPLEKTGVSPLMFWGGEIAASIATMNLFNPGNFVGASVAALFGE